MGWHKVSTLKVGAREVRAETCGLWTRGGLEGLQVHFDDVVINIPREDILMLVAQEYRDKQITRLEQMDTDELIAEMFGR